MVFLLEWETLFPETTPLWQTSQYLAISHTSSLGFLYNEDNFNIYSGKKQVDFIGIHIIYKRKQRIVLEKAERCLYNLGKIRINKVKEKI